MKKIVIILTLVILAGGLFLRSEETPPVVINEDIVEDIKKESSDIPTGILPFKSGVMGKVSLGPICPVMKNPPDPNCADKAYPTTVQVIAIGSPKSSPFATVETDKKGNYKAMLPPGEFGLQAIGGNPFPRCETRSITIEPDVMHEVDLSCDTGIR